jgi:hypothetical protein
VHFGIITFISKYYWRKQKEVKKGQNGVKWKDEHKKRMDRLARTTAIRAAAKVGKVTLTEAQERRLNEIEQGRYLDLVYGQFKSGERGTLLGVKDTAAISHRGYDAPKEENRRQFRQMLYESRA